MFQSAKNKTDSSDKTHSCFSVLICPSPSKISAHSYAHINLYVWQTSADLFSNCHCQRNILTRITSIEIPYHKKNNILNEQRCFPEIKNHKYLVWTRSAIKIFSNHVSKENKHFYYFLWGYVLLDKVTKIVRGPSPKCYILFTYDLFLLIKKFFIFKMMLWR